MKNDDHVYNVRTGADERLAHLSVPMGKQLNEIPELHAGDIGAVAKLKETLTGDTLGPKGSNLSYPRVDLPEPSIAYAVSAKSRNDEDRMGNAIARPVVFECVGSPGVLQALIEAAPAGAQIVVAGVCMETDRIEPSIAVTKEMELTFVLGYTPDEFAGTLRQLAEGIIDVSGLVTGQVGLDGVAKAFTDLGDPEAHVKILVEPNS